MFHSNGKSPLLTFLVTPVVHRARSAAAAADEQDDDADDDSNCEEE